MNLSVVKAIKLLLLLLMPSVLDPKASAVLVDASMEAKDYYPDERNDLLRIRDSLNSNANLHQNWTGPPCVDSESKWVGVSCSNWHVVSLVLEGIQLSGVLPLGFLQNITFLNKLSLESNLISGALPDLTNLVNLESVSLSRNRFSEGIPSGYIELPKLKQLQLQENYLDGEIPPFNQTSLIYFNVSYNHLNGQIPQTQVLQRLPGSCFEYNSGLCGRPLENLCPVSPPPLSPPIIPPLSPPSSPPPPKGKKKKNTSLQIWSVALIAAGSALISLLVMLLLWRYYKKGHAKAKEKDEQTGEGSADLSAKKMPDSPRTKDPERRVELTFFDKNISVFDLDDLLRASAEVLGKGRIGNTYKATMESGAVVAVKRVKNMNALSKKEFVQQMQLLGKLRHENLLNVLSFYYSREEKLIIYEFSPDGNLFDLLHESRGAGRIPLAWTTRLSIIKQIAEGLAFLHQTLHSHIVPHANIKSSNILISHDNEEYRAKLTDYGFLPLLPSRKASEKLAIGRSPEFHEGKKLTHKTDVYCFGIIILEVITGRIPGEGSPDDDETSGDLSEWVRVAVNTDWSTDILDVEILAASEGQNEMLRLTELALECTDIAPPKRPNMSEVLRRIEETNQPKIEENY